MIREMSRGLFVLFAVVLVAAGCGKKSPEPGTVKDEAMLAERDAKSFPAADEDYFKQMDGGIELTVDEVAHAAGTIGYEELTSLGRRYHRVYRG
jgi:hypothetical protein